MYRDVRMPRSAGCARAASLSGIDDKLHLSRTGTPERWPSGRRRAPAKGVYAKSVSRVRIPLSPPSMKWGPKGPHFIDGRSGFEAEKRVRNPDVQGWSRSRPSLAFAALVHPARRKCREAQD